MIRENMGLSKKYLMVVECAIEFEGKFLIILRPEGKHSGGMLAFPGGKVDEGDELHEWGILRSAARREALEEVGITLLDPLEYITSNYFIDSDGVPVIDTIFYCKLDQTSPHVTPSPREVPAFYWMSPEEINSAANSAEWLKKYIQLIIEHKNKRSFCFN